MHRRRRRPVPGYEYPKALKFFEFKIGRESPPLFRRFYLGYRYPLPDGDVSTQLIQKFFIPD
jgi:hypothetical protein